MYFDANMFSLTCMLFDAIKHPEEASSIFVCLLININSFVLEFTSKCLAIALCKAQTTIPPQFITGSIPQTPKP
eukprot:6469528-Amphidinium_carterae.1